MICQMICQTICQMICQMICSPKCGKLVLRESGWASQVRGTIIAISLRPTELLTNLTPTRGRISGDMRSSGDIRGTSPGFHRRQGNRTFGSRYAKVSVECGLSQLSRSSEKKNVENKRRLQHQLHDGRNVETTDIQWLKQQLSNDAHVGQITSLFFYLDHFGQIDSWST